MNFGFSATCGATARAMAATRLRPSGNVLIIPAKFPSQNILHLGENCVRNGKVYLASARQFQQLGRLAPPKVEARN